VLFRSKSPLETEYKMDENRFAITRYITRYTGLLPGTWENHYMGQYSLFVNNACTYHDIDSCPTPTLSGGICLVACDKH